MHPQLDSNTRERVIRLKKEGGWGVGRERERAFESKIKTDFSRQFFFFF